ncbi:U18-myrmicitoxin-Mri1a-like [Phlebotomus papatasi]|uniref:Uncharacterized protein n=1 Tax=Phlebotomus papatasi TaxID=29031 RepID=A0A1B0DHS5_PHLPP|nr:U18-myrmicitoxin-Mri1a-like [Phlebotomus papatasi]
MKFNQRIVLFVAVLSAVFPVIDTCSSQQRRKNSSVNPVRSPTAPPTIFSDCSTIYSSVYCLNGGRCFNYTIGHLHLPACQCPEGFMGERCELKYLSSIALADARMVAFVGVAILSIGVALLTLLSALSPAGGQW